MPDPFQTSVIPRLSISTRDHDPETFFRLWQRALSPLLNATALPDNGGDQEEQNCHQFNARTFMLVEANIPKQHFLRDAKWQRQHDDTDHLIVQFYLKGQSYTICGETEYLQDGSTSITNLAFPCEGFAASAHVMSLVLSRAIVQSEFPEISAKRGKLFAAGTMENRLFTGHLRTMRQEMELATTEDIPALTAGVLGLMKALIRKPEDMEATALQSALLETIKCYIRANLQNRSLDSEDLIRRFGISRSRLFRLFQDLGGVSSYIQEERLSACFRALTDPNMVARPIYEIAGQCGLTNTTHLSTQFRKRYGQTPRDLRQTVRHAMKKSEDIGLVLVEGNPADIMRQWYLDLGK